MIAFGIEWLEGDDGFIAEQNDVELRIKPGRGRTWKWFAEAGEWKASGIAPKLTMAQMHCAALACGETTS